MGWAYGINTDGREVGYSVEATCDHEGCAAKIDRGLGYVCGSMHDGDEYGCGRYFCGEHLGYWFWGDEEIPSPQLCEECGARFETATERPTPPEWFEDRVALETWQEQ